MLRSPWWDGSGWGRLGAWDLPRWQASPGSQTPLSSTFSRWRGKGSPSDPESSNSSSGLVLLYSSYPVKPGLFLLCPRTNSSAPCLKVPSLFTALCSIRVGVLATVSPALLQFSAGSVFCRLEAVQSVLLQEEFLYNKYVYVWCLGGGGEFRVFSAFQYKF